MRSRFVVWTLLVGGLGAGYAVGEAERGQLADKGVAARGEATRKERSAASTPRGGDKEDTKTRFREGSQIVNELGEFQKSGDRVNFFPKSGKETTLRVLENLALERIVRTLEDYPSVRSWSVTGVLTEYRNDNYLLVTKAIVRARSGGDDAATKELLKASEADTSK